MKWAVRVLVGVAGTLLLILIWGVAIEPRLIDEEEYQVALPRLPTAWHGQRVALIADLQVGMWLANTDTIRRLVARLVEQRPAAVLIAWDFVYHPLDEEPEEAVEELVGEEIRTVVALLRPLPAAGVPTYAELGDHDYGMKVPTSLALPWLAHRVREALEAVGVHVLHNEALVLEPPKDSGGSDRGTELPLYLVSIAPYYPGEDRPLVALAQVPDGAPRLVLLYHPDLFAQLPAGTAPLAMVGAHPQRPGAPALPPQMVMVELHQRGRGTRRRLDPRLRPAGEPPLRQPWHRLQPLADPH